MGNRTKASADKSLGALDVTRDVTQIKLFEFLEPQGNKRDYSNTIELYDALPKYVWDRGREMDDLSNAVVTRQCTVRGQQFTVTVKPAIIERDDGRVVLIYAGQREEIVEDALRKLATDGGGRMIDGTVGVTFTLYELRQELARMGHSYKLSEIKEAIEVCRGATLTCSSGDGETVISSSFFPMIGLTTRREYLKHGSDARCYVQFHALVNESVMRLSFRQYNYRIGMEIRSPLARYIYKRMSHYWTQASPKLPYTPSLVTFLRQSPRDLSPRMSENIRAMKQALDVLVEQEVICEYVAEPVKEGRKVIDVRYTILPHPTFVSEMRAANRQQQLLFGENVPVVDESGN